MTLNFLYYFRIHRSHIVKDFCAEEDIELVFNVAYRPDLQSGIERVWMLAKKKYRELVDKYKANNLPFGNDGLVETVML